MAISMCLTFAITQANAKVAVSQGTIGDVLMFSLYDVREDPLRTQFWENFLVIENTSGAWTACHIRFRGYEKSIEVWDRVILLSPYDVFWLDLVRDPATDQVKIWSTDSNTLMNSGLTYAEGEKFEDYFKTDLMVECGYPDDPVETQHGEVEVIGLWSLEIPDDGDGNPATLPNGVEDTHDLSEVVRDLYQGYKLDGVTPEGAVINVYDVMYALFYEFDPFGTAQQPCECRQPPLPNTDFFWDAGWETYDDSEVWINQCEAVQVQGCCNCDPLFTRMAFDCDNILTGAYEMGDIGNGRYELQNFVVLRDFRTDDPNWTAGPSDFHRDQWHNGEIVFPPTVMSTDINIATYSQRFDGFDVVDDPLAYYLNESWSSTTGPGLRDGDDDYAVNADWPVQAFNNIWSLDDVEGALGKTDLWFHYFNDWNPGKLPGLEYDTIVSMSFPTKHYHYWFWDASWMVNLNADWGNWPWWEDDLSIDDPQGYLTRITNLRKNIAYDFDYYYSNGEVKADSRIWNENEVLFHAKGSATGSPVSWEQVIIPHEVNAIKVEVPPIGEPDGLLSLRDPIDELIGVPFELGHFNISNIRLMNGMRGVWLGDHLIYNVPGAGTPYSLYPVGGVVFLNCEAAIVRSCLSNWHYKLPDPFPFLP